MRLAIATALALLASPALAQQGPVIELSALSDYRERGLSWSDGKPTAQAYAELPVGQGFTASLQTTATREAARHRGADAAVRLSGGYSGGSGLVTWRGAINGHVFPGGAGPLNYVELDLAGSASLGPAELEFLASYAPAQRAIGGSNFYGRVRARAGIVGTPFTARAHLGHSTGSVDDAVRAARLRPGGHYTDWGVGLDYAIRRIVLEVSYTDTDIDTATTADGVRPQHAGARIVFAARISL